MTIAGSGWMPGTRHPDLNLDLNLDPDLDVMVDVASPTEKNAKRTRKERVTVAATTKGVRA